MKEIEYDRFNAIKYAKYWASKRNPEFYDFETHGGDCTNFASQCLYYGAKTMNYTPTFGWYYKSAYDRTPSWTGVDFFYNFIINNKDIGPYGEERSLNNIDLGDFIQLGHENDDFYHTLIVTSILNGEILVSAHTFDVYNKPLNNYVFSKLRCIHIKGVRF